MRVKLAFWSPAAGERFFGDLIDKYGKTDEGQDDHFQERLRRRVEG
jgi:hypothetical protein